MSVPSTDTGASLRMSLVYLLFQRITLGSRRASPSIKSQAYFRKVLGSTRPLSSPPASFAKSDSSAYVQMSMSAHKRCFGWAFRGISSRASCKRFHKTLQTRGLAPNFFLHRRRKVSVSATRLWRMLDPTSKNKFGGTSFILWLLEFIVLLCGLSTKTNLLPHYSHWSLVHDS